MTIDLFLGSHQVLVHACTLLGLMFRQSWIHIGLWPHCAAPRRLRLYYVARLNVVQFSSQILHTFVSPTTILLKVLPAKDRPLSCTNVDFSQQECFSQCVKDCKKRNQLQNSFIVWVCKNQLNFEWLTNLKTELLSLD